MKNIKIVNDIVDNTILSPEAVGAYITLCVAHKCCDNETKASNKLAKSIATGNDGDLIEVWDLAIDELDQKGILDDFVEMHYEIENGYQIKIEKVYQLLMMDNGIMPILNVGNYYYLSGREILN